MRPETAEARVQDAVPLLGCPFCGEPAGRGEVDGIPAIRCSSCDAALLAWEEWRPAEEQWNARHVTGPWHYITEEPPEPWTIQRFWLRTTDGPFPSRGRMGADGSYEATDGSGYHFGPAEAARRIYAWQPEPEPPPLPESEP